jgi:hypothetical protein
MDNYDWFNSSTAKEFEDDPEWSSLIATEPTPNYSSSKTKDNQQMITVNRNNQGSGDGANIPKGVQFLSPRHVTSPEGLKAIIFKVTTDKVDNFGNPYVVYFKSGNDKYSKGFKATSDNLISLVDMFGDDEKKWIGQSVVIGKKIDDDGGERLCFTKGKK